MIFLVGERVQTDSSVAFRQRVDNTEVPHEIVKRIALSQMGWVDPSGAGAESGFDDGFSQRGDAMARLFAIAPCAGRRRCGVPPRLHRTHR